MAGRKLSELPDLLAVKAFRLGPQPGQHHLPVELPGDRSCAREDGRAPPIPPRGDRTVGGELESSRVERCIAVDTHHGSTKDRPGHLGELRIKSDGAGAYTGRVYYRRPDGTRGEAVASSKSKVGIDRSLKSKLPQLVSARTSESVADAAAPITLGDVVEERLKFEELKLPERLKALGTHTEHLRMLRRHILPAFGDTPVTAITSSAVFNFHTAMAATHAPLARNVKILLKQVLERAVNLGHVTGAYPAVTVTGAMARRMTGRNRCGDIVGAPRR